MKSEVKTQFSLAAKSVFLTSQDDQVVISFLINCLIANHLKFACSVGRSDQHDSAGLVLSMRISESFAQLRERLRSHWV